MSQLSDFYTLKGTDDKGRTFAGMCSYDWHELEGVHDYIQWLFPLRLASNFNPDAPLLTDQDIELINKDLVHYAFRLMCNFYGCTYENNEVKIEPGIWWERSEAWITPGNHNFLRITRILKSLSLLGMTEERDDFFIFLKGLYQQHRETITKETMHFWREAIQ